MGEEIKPICLYELDNGFRYILEGVRPNASVGESERPVAPPIRGGYLERYTSLVRATEPQSFVRHFRMLTKGGSSCVKPSISTIVLGENVDSAVSIGSQN